MMGYSAELEKGQELIRAVWPEWELMEQLGSGQYGIVWKARKQGFAGDSFAAIKIVTIEDGNNEKGLNPEQTDAYYASVAHNYAREIRMMESVKGYSNIVNIEDYSVCKNTGGRPWYVLIRMELLTPLYEYLENRDITDGTVIRISTDLCRALEVCAKKKIVHRDIKPANVFVNDEGIFKLGDFGVARQILNYTSQTRTGTPDFMAPEVYNGSLHATDHERAQSADIYSLGMLLYWIANGKRMPFLKQDGLITADEISEAFARKMSGEKLPDPVDASDSLARVILKACAYDASGRYRSAGEMRQALEGLRAQEKPAEKKKRKAPFIIAAAALVLVLAAGYIVLRIIPPVSGPDPVPISVTPTPAVAAGQSPEEAAQENRRADAEESAPETAVLPGDVTGDGTVDLVDLIRMMKTLSDRDGTLSADAGAFSAAETDSLSGTPGLKLAEGTQGSNVLEGPQKLLDGNISTKWCVKMDGECHVIFSTKEPVSINGYVLYKANDDTVYPDRSPFLWTLYGAASDAAPKPNDPAWKVIDDHTDTRDRIMRDAVDYESYAFVFNEEIPEYNYYMLVVRETLGDSYMQLSELQLICGNTLEVQLAATANPEKAVAAMGDLVFDRSAFELVPTEDTVSDRMILGGGLTPVRVPDIRTVRLKLREGAEWPSTASVSVGIVSAYNIREARVGQLKYSQCVISERVWPGTTE